MNEFSFVVRMNVDSEAKAEQIRSCLVAALALLPDVDAVAIGDIHNDGVATSMAQARRAKMKSLFSG